MVGDDPEGAQEDPVVEEADEDDGDDAGGEEGMKNLGDNSKLNVACLVVSEKVFNPGNLKTVKLKGLSHPDIKVSVS